MSRVFSRTRPVILFSQNYLPMAEINLQRAAVLLVTDRAEPLSLLPGAKKVWQMRSPNRILDIPEHIRLLVGGSDRIWKTPPVNRREVLKRDRHTCQYCGSQKQLTLDHVIPKSWGGQHSWDNVVAACSACNTAKGARSPELAKMELARKPKAPMHPVVAFAEQFWKEHKV
ncbi:MAG: HNH endonuclease [Cyanobacteria bacterium J06627_28]